MRICVVIPVHNEAKGIGPLVENLKKLKLDVVVVNDGSQDSSESIARENGAIIIRNEEKQGKGFSLREGFQFAISQHYDGVITMDGDGQHDPNEVDRFIEEAERNKARVITGSRMQNPRNMPLVRLLVNKIMSSAISLVCRQRIPDTQCGFRFIRTDVLKELSLSCRDFEIESEVLIQASKKGFKISSIPIRSIYRNELSKINPLKDTVRFINYMIKEIWFSKNS